MICFSYYHFIIDGKICQGGKTMGHELWIVNRAKPLFGVSTILGKAQSSRELQNTNRDPPGPIHQFGPAGDQQAQISHRQIFLETRPHLQIILNDAAGRQDVFC